MAWTSPRTWVAGELLTAALLNTHVRDNLLAVGGTTGAICTRVFHSANQSIPNTTPTVLAFDSEAFDTDTMHGSPNSRITITTAGKYRLCAQVKWDLNATGYRGITIRDSAANVIAEVFGPAGPATAQTTQQVTILVDCAAAAWFDVAVAQTSGGALNAVGAAGNPPTWFSAEKV